MKGFDQRLKVVCDFDDVLAVCNEYALQMLEEREGIHCDVDDIKIWGLTGTDIDRRLQYFKEASFYDNQPAIPEARFFLNSLMEMANVSIVTAVDPEFMGNRIKRISELFPEFPLDHVLMGTRKDLIQSDVMLDDGLHNLVNSSCRLPVLFDRPWNRSVSGICRIRNYDEFLTLMNHLVGKKSIVPKCPKVICLIGPSGSGKHEVAEALGKYDGFSRIVTQTTSESVGEWHNKIDNDSFLDLVMSKSFLETTFYNGGVYGILKKDAIKTLEKHEHAVCVMDISGCLSVYNAMPERTVIVYLDRDKRECVKNTLTKPNLTNEQMTDRIMSIDYERKNSVLADAVIKVDEDVAITAEKIRMLVETNNY